jgi:hypothetical protein
MPPTMKEDEPSSLLTLGTGGENELDSYHSNTVKGKIKELSW